MFDIRNFLMSFRFEMNNGAKEGGRKIRNFLIYCEETAKIQRISITRKRCLTRRKIESSSKFDYTFS